MKKKVCLDEQEYNELKSKVDQLDKVLGCIQVSVNQEIITGKLKNGATIFSHIKSVDYEVSFDLKEILKALGFSNAFIEVCEVKTQ